MDRLQVFALALLLDDFELQDALYALPEVKWTLESLPRFAQVREYYLCCSGVKSSYDEHGQFNTFSAESWAKYGKVTEQVVGNSAYVDSQVLCVYADDLGAVSVRGCESEEEACLASTPVAFERRGDHLEVDLRTEKAKVMCVMYPGKVLFVKNEHNQRQVQMVQVQPRLLMFAEPLTGKPVNVYVEVVDGGEVVQSGYTDLLGLFSMNSSGTVRLPEFGLEWTVE